MDGDIDKALKRTWACYPAVLRDNPRIYFRLRCRKFVEMMRQPSAPPTPRTKSAKPAASAAAPVDVFEHAMELDDDEPAPAPAPPAPDDDGWDRMETDAAAAAAAGGPDPTVAALRYAQELRGEYKDERSREVQDALHDIFALFAYADPRASPMVRLLDPRGRAPVAEALNAAILGTSAPPPFPQKARGKTDGRQSRSASPRRPPSSACASRRRCWSRTSATTAGPARLSTSAAMFSGSVSREALELGVGGAYGGVSPTTLVMSMHL